MKRIIKNIRCWRSTVFFIPILLFSLAAIGQKKGMWVEFNVKDEMTNETELKKRCPKCSFLGKAGDNGLSYEMVYFSDVDKKNHTYRGHVKWEWTLTIKPDSLIPGEIVTIKGLVSNLSGEPTGSVSAWAQLGTWGFMKPAAGNTDFAGPNGNTILIGSFTVPKGPSLNRDGTVNPYFVLTFHLSGGNDTRFIRRIITYKWAEFVDQPAVKTPGTPQPPVDNSNKPMIVTQKDVYKTGEPIVVVFKNLPGFAKDWIGIYGARAYHAREYIEWKYTNGVKEGTLTFNSPRYGPGEYMFRVYENNGYKLLAQSVVFKVIN